MDAKIPWTTPKVEVVNSQEGPEAGHRFHFTMTSQGSYSVVGVEGHTDSDMLSEPWTVTVRAWNLPDALRKAADLSLDAWDMGL